MIRTELEAMTIPAIKALAPEGTVFPSKLRKAEIIDMVEIILNTPQHNGPAHLDGYGIDCTLCESECRCDDGVATGNHMPCVYCQDLAQAITDEISEVVEAMEIAFKANEHKCSGCVKCIGFMTNLKRRAVYNKQTGRSVHTTGYYQGTERDGERRYFPGQFTPAQRRRMAKKARKHALTAEGLTNNHTGRMHWFNSEFAITCK